MESGLDSGRGTKTDDRIIDADTQKAQDICRSDTPDTLLSNDSNKPDITLLCELCHEYIDLCHLQYHRTYHEALVTLDYNHSLKPTDVKSLLQRRYFIFKKLQTDKEIKKNMCYQSMKKVDDAYEELKNYIDDICKDPNFINHKVGTGVEGMALNCSCDCVQAVGICKNENQRWKSCMEDYLVFQDYFGEDRNKSYFAIFDGYNGANAAQKSSRELHHLLLYELAKSDSKIRSTMARNFAESVTERKKYEELRPETKDSFRVNLHQDSTAIIQNILSLCYQKYEKIIRDKRTDIEEKARKSNKTKYHFNEEIQNAFKTAYLLTDILLSYGEDEKSKVRWSGTSALTIMIQNLKSEANENANTGEPCDDFEKKSYVKTTGDVKPEEFFGLIHVANTGNSRALLIQNNKAYCLTKDHTAKNPTERKRVLLAGGSFSNSERDSKVNGVLSVTRGLGNHGDKKLKDCVIVDPYFITVPIEKNSQFLVLASNGVWQVLSDHEVVTLLVQMLPDQQIPPPSRASESLLPLLQSQQRNDSGATSKKSQSHSEHQYCQGSIYQEQMSQSGKIHKPEGDECADVQQVSITSPQLSQECLSSFNHSDFKELKEVTKDNMRKELAKSMAEKLTQAALMAGTKDNTSVIVVLLPACGI